MGFTELYKFGTNKQNDQGWVNVNNVNVLLSVNALIN